MADADRELLELAAKAAGIVYDPLHQLIKVTTGWHAWNPLTDDGDALRLAVNLEVGPLISSNFVYIKRYYEDTHILRDPLGADRYAATRRAIVRAAAEIGRAMP